MHSHKKAIIFFATCALLIPRLSFAGAGITEGKGTNYNMTLICLVGLILILLFVIGMLAHTLSQLSFVVRDKNRKEKQTAATATKVLSLLSFLFLSASSLAATGSSEGAAQSPQFISGIPVADFYLITGVITLELLIIFSLAFLIKTLLKAISNVPELQTKAQAITRKSWFWDKLNSAASIEKETDILLDHNYDGIMELDNSLPPWWKYGFYLTILVAIIYIYRFHVSNDGLSQQEEYIAEMEQGEADKAAYLAKSANNVDENSVTLLSSAGDIANGRETFTRNCVACHLADGGGSVGPNLTDDYWLHGGGLKDVFKSIKYGWQDKGMKSWKDDLSPKQIQEVASFVKSLKGTHPAVPKAQQGELYIEAQPKTGTDSVNTPKVAGK